MRDVIGEAWVRSGWLDMGLFAAVVFPLGLLDVRLEDEGEAAFVFSLA